MTQLIDDVAYLSDEIGARPAGTEEEQQAALFIAESLQRDSGFQAIIEDFNGMSNPDLPKAICFGVAFVCGLVALLVPLLLLPAAIISLVMAVLYGLEVTGRPVLSRFLKGGVSQNVVAKYQPAGVPNKKRKVILVANYDSGRVMPEQKGFLRQNRRMFELVLIGGLVLLPLLMLLRAIVFPGASGTVETFFNVLIVLFMIVVAVPVVLAVVHSRAQYTEAANNNATGVAVLLDVARKVGTGCVSLEEMERMASEEGVEVEGEQAAREAGAVPDGTEIEYATDSNRDIEVVPEVPVDGSRFEDGIHREFVDESLAQVDEVIDSSQGEGIAESITSNDSAEDDSVAEGQESQSKSTSFSFAQPAAPATPFPTGTMSGGIPSWARTAQAKAHENKPEQAMVHTPAVRSRYADTPAAQILSREVASHTGAFAPVAQEAIVSAPEDAAAPQAEAEVSEVVSEPEVAPAPQESATPVQAPASSRPSYSPDRQRSGSFSNPWSGASASGSNSALSARLAALRSEIQSAPVPHVSDEVRKAFDAMDELDSKQTVSNVVSRETTKSDRAVVENSSESAAPVEDSVPSETSAKVEASFRGAEPVQQISSYEERDVDILSLSNPVTADVVADRDEEEIRAEDHERVEEAISGRSARPLRRSSSASFGGFMDKIHKVAENVADAASGVGARIGEAASEAGSRFAAATPDGKVEDVETNRGEAQSAEPQPEKSPEHIEAELVDGVDSRIQDDDSNELSDVVVEEAVSQVVEGDVKEDVVLESVVDQDDETQRRDDAPVEVREASDPTSKTIHRAKAAVVQDSYEDDPEPMGSLADSFDEKDESNEVSGTFAALDDDSFAVETEPEAVQAVDVSSFMNKPIETPAPQPEDKTDFAAGDEVTQPVSMAEVREAISQVTRTNDGNNGFENQGDAPSRERKASRRSKKTRKPRSVDETVVASPIMGLDPSSLPSIGEAGEGKRQMITLPELNSSTAEHVEQQSQRAPMADVSSAPHSPLVSGALPRIGADDFALENHSSSDRFGLDLPPLGVESEVSHEKVSTTSSFSTAGGTGAFAPVGDELVEGIPEENLYVDDADDSAFDSNHTETGAFAGPEYVDLPQSRVGKFFGRFGSKKKKAQEENSMHEWIGTDENYTAHGAGVNRGSWESFREGPEAESDDSRKSNSGSWQGGAFDLDTLRALSQKAGKTPAEAAAQSEGETPVSSVTEGVVTVDDFNMAPEPETNSRVEELNKEMRQINEFRHPGIDTEVWFVALGSEVGSNSGMEAFLANHADELDGAIVVNLQALGDGKLSYIDTEGVLMPIKPTSRMKRFVRNAAARTGISVTNAKLLSVETPASYAMRRGLKAFSIVGVKDGKPAHYAEADDRIENVNAKALESASKFVMELLKVM